jgi:beta-glucanase (GH16 family)
MIWNDEFETTSLDTLKWSNDVGGNGWGNNEAQYYTSGNSNLTFSNGLLSFTAKLEQFNTNQYTSSKISSKNLFNIQYGKIEGRMKCPMGKGLWPAFWMLGTNIDSITWPGCGEIDIMEHINSETKVHGTAHWDNVGHQFLGGFINTDPTLFHTYAITWDSTYIKWYIDDQLYYLLNITNNANGTDEFHKSFYLILNLAVGGDWPGYPEGTTVFPADFVVDYVRVYKDQSELTIDELSSSKLTIFPNPTNELLSIEGMNDSETAKYKVYSIRGEKLIDQTLDVTKIIDVSELKSGIYFLELYTADGMKQFTFSKN